MKKKLIEECKTRFGAEFTEYQLKTCKDLFDQFNKQNKDQLDFDEIYGIFEYMFNKGLTADEKIQKEDIGRLLEMINYNKDGQVTFEEF